MKTLFSGCHELWLDSQTPRVEFSLQEIEDTFEAWLDSAEDFYTSDRQNGITPDEQAFVLLANKVVSITTNMVDKAHVRLMTRSEEVATTVHKAWVTLCATLVAALVFGGIVAYHLQRRLTKPVSDLLNLIKQSRLGKPRSGTVLL